MGFDYINKWKKQRGKRKTDLKKLQHGLMNRTKYYGSDIFQKPNFKKTAKFVQHGDVSVRKHSISVALTALRISHMLPFHTNDKAIVRGALLHDYFLYDWHKNKIRPSRFYKFYELIQGRSIILAVNIPLSYVKSHPPPVFSTMWRTD